MISTKTMFTLLFGAALCSAETINISGTVQDKAGVGVSGATVKLEKARIAVTTGADGSFTLTSGPAALREISNDGSIGASLAGLKNGSIEFSLSKNTLVTAAGFDVGGKQLFCSRTLFCKGTHRLRYSGQARGISLVRVNIGKEILSCTMSPWGSIGGQRLSSTSGNGVLTKQVKATAVLADIISVVKEGQIEYRDSIRTSDTSGMVINLVQNAGTVRDGSGNEYQSVQIGNQQWTVQNLRTAKYNDGTVLPLVTATAAWDNLSTPGYCFYTNSTDTAYQKKWGALYNWHAVKTGKLAPAGWRVPTQADWTALKSYLMANNYNWDGTTTEDKIAKSMGARTDWLPCPESDCKGTIGNDPGSNNSTGFSALPGGSRGSSVGFMEQSEAGHWWSATMRGTATAHSYNFRYSGEGIGMDYSGLRDGFAVRLVRDAK